MKCLHYIFDGKKGKDLAFYVECAMDAGIIIKPSFSELSRWFDIKGSDTAFNKYFLKDYFKPLEKKAIIESLKKRTK